MRQKELRLALICYGGVSLAIYMHGITKEVWKLARASRDYHEHREPAADSTRVYHRMLQWIEQHCGMKLRIVPDIIAGASAGGINGIFLAQAIASGESLEPLTDMWLNLADVDELLDPDARPLSRFSKFWAEPIAWFVAGRKGGTVEQTVSEEARDEVKLKLSRFVRARWFQPPFGGKIFSRLILRALTAMRDSGSAGKLLPPGHPLDLFVTVTDFAGHPEKLLLHSPAHAVEMEHRITMAFSTRDNSGFPLADTAALTFAGRATASFPGAFPACTVREIDTVLDEHDMVWAGRDAFLQANLPHHYQQGTIEDAALIDGSVLANAPFSQAIGALKNRPARRKVDRRFVYIDPRPDLALVKTDRRLEKMRARQEEEASVLPGFFSTIFGAVANIPREQPIRDNLDALAARTKRVEQMRRITDGLRAEVDVQVGTLLGKTLLLDRPTARRLGNWRTKAQIRAGRLAGFGYAAYGHLKLGTIVDDIVATIRRGRSEKSEGSNLLLREAVWRAVRELGLEQISGREAAGPTQAAIDFFLHQDIGYRLRRLRLLARRLAEDVDRSERFDDPKVEAMHDAIYDALSLYIERQTRDFLGEDFARIAEAAETAPDAALAYLADCWELPELDKRVDAMLATAIADLPKEAKRTMLLAYLGFPFYDIATLPLLQGEGQDEFDPIKVDRISPDDAPAIRSGGAKATLRGIELNNFGAFFSRSYRENDYLWGRLHGSERLVDIVFSTLEAKDNKLATEILGFKKQLFLAILDEEEAQLQRVQPLIADLRREIEETIPSPDD